MNIKTDGLCVCVSGLVVTLAGFPESSTELHSVRLAERIQSQPGNAGKNKTPGTCEAKQREAG